MSKETFAECVAVLLSCLAIRRNKHGRENARKREAHTYRDASAPRSKTENAMRVRVTAMHEAIQRGALPTHRECITSLRCNWR